MEGGGNAERGFSFKAFKGSRILCAVFLRYKNNPDGTVEGIYPNREGVPAQAVRRVVKDFDNAFIPTAFAVPFIETIHDRITIEICRGCTRRVQILSGRVHIAAR